MRLRGSITVLTLWLGALGGCCGPQTVLPANHRPRPIKTYGPAPSYATLVRRYNANVAGLNRLWARNEASIAWITKTKRGQKDYHRESGAGKLIVVRNAPSFGLTGPRPGVTLTLGALGHTLFWAGSNAERYWLFDLRGDGTAYVGTFNQSGRVQTQGLPIPIHPSVAPYLLGLMPIEAGRGPGRRGGGGGVQEVAGYYEIQAPGSNIRYLIDPRTGLPKRVTVLGVTGDPLLISHLEHYDTVERAGIKRENWPWLASDIEVYPLDREAKLTMHLSGLTDGKRKDRINPAVFNFQALRQAHDPARIIDLDE